MHSSLARRNKEMKSKLLVLGLLAGSSLFAGTRVFVGVGGYAPPPVVAYATPCPGPGYNWVAGFWDYSGPRRFWRAGYWAPPRYRVERFDRDHDRGRDFRGDRDRDRDRH
jgi:hypothetical protein